jgi:hypothetical protein
VRGRRERGSQFRALLVGRWHERALEHAVAAVNALIERFQTTLRSMNLGLEVWPATLDSELWNEQGEDGEDFRRGFIDVELGFVKMEREWVLATRLARYEWDSMPSGELDKDGNETSVPWIDRGRASRYDASQVTPLLQESRNVRILALEHFPEIVKALQEAAEAIRAIEEAKKFVMPPPDKITFADVAAAAAAIVEARTKK